MRCTVLLAAALVTGCAGNPNTAPVTGKVTYKGQGLTAGSVWFHAAGDNPWRGEKPSCQLQTDGSFTMRTYPYGDGVPPGSYTVTLSPELAGRIGKPSYADPAKSPWTIDVPGGGVADVLFEVR